MGHKITNNPKLLFELVDKKPRSIVKTKAPAKPTLITTTTAAANLDVLMAAVLRSCKDLGLDRQVGPEEAVEAITALALNLRIDVKELREHNAKLLREVESLRPAGVVVETIRRRLLGLPKE